MTQWYVTAGGKTYGPFSSAQLKQLADTKKITPESNVRQGTDGKWTAARNVKGLFESKAVVAVATQQAQAAKLKESIIGSNVSSKQTAVQPAKRQCPFCGEEILESAIKCRHCNEFVDGRSQSVGSTPAAPQHAVQVNLIQHGIDSSVHASNGSARALTGTDKRILPAILLAFFLGGFGAHRFYTGNTGSAIGILLMTLFGAMLSIVLIGFIPLMIAGVWIIVDMILLATGSFRDANGVKITAWT